MQSVQSNFNQMISIAGLLRTQTKNFSEYQETQGQLKASKRLESKQQTYLQKYGKDVEYYNPEIGKKVIGRNIMTEDEYISTLKDKSQEAIDAERALYQHDIGEFNKYEKQLSNINSDLFAKNKLKGPTGTYERAMINAQQSLEDAKMQKYMTKENR